MHNVLKLLNKSFGVYNIKGIYVEPTYWMAGVIAILIFMMLFTVARIRFLYVHWHLNKHSIAFLFYGFLFATILEGFMIVSGRTIFTQVLGWKNPPKPISTILDAGRSKLVDVLGASAEVPSSYAQEAPTYESVLGDYESLSFNEKESVRGFICKP